MKVKRKSWRIGAALLVIAAAMALAVVMLSPAWLKGLIRSHQPRMHVPTMVVARADLSVSMTTAGRVDSTDKTIVECQLEALDVNVRGRTAVAGGASTILSMVTDGTSVKKGEVLAVLDASAYEELVIAQSMNVERARAEYRQAELVREVAQTAVLEYRDGLMLQYQRTLEGQIALSKSDLERTTDRLAWTKLMVGKGYLSKGQANTEQFQERQQALNLSKSETTLRLFKKFSAPIYLRVLESEVLGADSLLSYQTSKLQRFEERLAVLKKQVELCTIRAPHAGFVIYANDPMRNFQIELGMSVRQKQRLFYLPNLGRMEVAMLLHESVVKDVKAGMMARVRIEGLSNRELEGHVVSISTLPVQTQQSMFSDVKYFEGIVTLDAVPMGLRPGMSAEVDIKTIRRPGVLAVPTEALTMEAGQDVCYVAHEDHLERREVKLGQSTRDLFEVTEGLAEGEEVVLDPTHYTSPMEVARNISRAAPEREQNDTVSLFTH